MATARTFGSLSDVAARAAYVPSIYRAQAQDFIAATQRVWMDRDAPSGLEVQVLP